MAGTKNESVSGGVEKKSRQSKQNETYTLGSDIPDELNKKEKFKMVIPKNKKDGSDQPPRESQPEMAVGVDAAAAAAILQAVQRGIKHPNLEILSKASGSESSQPQKSREQGVSSVRTSAKAIAETAAMAAAGEADSSEASLTQKQKLKAERLKRAKMFATMLKVGAVPSKTSTDLVVSGSGSEMAEREREGSSVPPDIDALARRSKRRYRSRKNEEEIEEEDEDGDEMDDKHSRKKSRHRSSHHSKERHKHRKRHSSSKDVESRHRRHRRHKQDSSSDDDDDDNHHRKHQRGSYEDGDGHVRSKRSRRRHSRRSRSRSRSQSRMEKQDFEKKVIIEKLGESRATDGDREVSQPLETITDVPDDLRAKIRAMLMATM